MLVVRLVILAILLYVAWLIIRGTTSRSTTSAEKKAGSGKANEKTSSQDVLVEDPVCHTLVPKHQAIRMRKGEETYYFCSDKCCDKFSESGRGEQ